VVQNRTPKARSSMDVSGTCYPRATQYQAYMRDRRRHTELSRNVPPFLTLQSVKKDPSVYSEYTPSHTDTPSIRSYSLKNENSVQSPDFLFDHENTDR
jgi:hypothetical protein